MSGYDTTYNTNVVFEQDKWTRGVSLYCLINIIKYVLFVKILFKPLETHQEFIHKVGDFFRNMWETQKVPPTNTAKLSAGPLPIKIFAEENAGTFHTFVFPF